MPVTKYESLKNHNINILGELVNTPDDCDESNSESLANSDNPTSALDDCELLTNETEYNRLIDKYKTKIKDKLIIFLAILNHSRDCVKNLNLSTLKSLYTSEADATVNDQKLDTLVNEISFTNTIPIVPELESIISLTIEDSNSKCQSLNNSKPSLQKIIDTIIELVSIQSRRSECLNPLIDRDKIGDEPSEVEKKDIPEEEPEIESGPCEIYPNKATDKDWGIRFTYKDESNIVDLYRNICQGTTGSFYNSETRSLNSPQQSSDTDEEDVEEIIENEENREVDSSNRPYTRSPKLHEWEMTLLPAMRSVVPKTPGMDVPNAMPGLQFQIRSNIAKHRVPGGQAIYQNLGIDSVMVTLVGCFTGDGGFANEYSLNLDVGEDGSVSNPNNSAMTPRLRGGNIWEQVACPCDPNDSNDYLNNSSSSYIVGSGSNIIPQSNSSINWGQRSTMFTLFEQAKRLDSYHEFTSFYKIAIEEGREFEVEINLDKYNTGLKSENNLFKDYGLDSTSSIKHEDRDWGPLRNGNNGNPRFKGLVKAMEVYHSRSDRTWYLMQMELTDLGLSTDIPLNLTKDASDAANENLDSLLDEDGFVSDLKRMLDCLLRQHADHVPMEYQNVMTRTPYRTGRAIGPGEQRIVWSQTTGQGMIYKSAEIESGEGDITNRLYMPFRSGDGLSLNPSTWDQTLFKEVRKITYAVPVSEKLLEPSEMLTLMAEGGATAGATNNIDGIKKYVHTLETGAVYALPRNAAGNCVSKPYSPENRDVAEIGSPIPSGEGELSYGNILGNQWISTLLRNKTSTDPSQLNYWKPAFWRTGNFNTAERVRLEEAVIKELEESRKNRLWIMDTNSGLSIYIISRGPLQGYGIARSRQNSDYVIINPAGLLTLVAQRPVIGATNIDEYIRDSRNAYVLHGLREINKYVCLLRNPKNFINTVSNGFGSLDPSLTGKRSESCMNNLSIDDLENTYFSNAFESDMEYKNTKGEVLSKLFYEALLSCAILLTNFVGGAFISLAPAATGIGAVISIILIIFLLINLLADLMRCLIEIMKGIYAAFFMRTEKGPYTNYIEEHKDKEFGWDFFIFNFKYSMVPSESRWMGDIFSIVYNLIPLAGDLLKFMGNIRLSSVTRVITSLRRNSFFDRILGFFEAIFRRFKSSTPIASAASSTTSTASSAASAVTSTATNTVPPRGFDILGMFKSLKKKIGDLLNWLYNQSKLAYQTRLLNQHGGNPLLNLFIEFWYFVNRVIRAFYNKLIDFVIWLNKLFNGQRTGYFMLIDPET
ncbi:hypothetical protein V6O07_01250, partial [Arthrospira platensis SPKY2]